MAGDAEQLGKEGHCPIGFPLTPPEGWGAKTFPSTPLRPWIDKVRMSLASGAATHPFQEADLEELRAILRPRHLHERCPGQPFLLDLVSHLASLSGDPDWEFPLTLKEGVPLGV